MHERFTGDELRAYRAAQAGDVQILAHPECPPDVLAEADFVGSTAGMIRHVGETRPRRVVMVTECSMSDNVAVDVPRRRVRPPVQSLPAHEADHAAEDPALAARRWSTEVDGRSRGRPAARALAVERMLAVGRREGEMNGR